MNKLLNSNLYREGEEEKAKAEADAKAKVDADAKAETERANDPFRKLNFTSEQQEFFNKRMMEERRALQQQNQNTITELKKLQAQSSTTEQQRKELQARIEELQRQHLSKEEIVKQEQERQQREYQQALQTQKSEAELWRNRYHESTITRALQDGAVEFEAFNPNQIIDLLAAKTKLVEEIDANNQSTGRLVPRVHFTDYDSDGVLKTFDLSVRDALLKMKNTPEKYGNLFKSTLAGGLGQSANANGATRKKDPSKYSTKEWMEMRKKDPNFTELNK